MTSVQRQGYVYSPPQTQGPAAPVGAPVAGAPLTQSAPDAAARHEPIVALVDLPPAEGQHLEQMILPDEASMAAEPTGDVRTAQGARTVSVTRAAPATTTTNVNASVQWVLRDSYLETTRDLLMHYDKVSFFNDVKKALRDELGRANGELAKMAGQEDDARLYPPFQTRPIDTEYLGQPFEAAPAPVPPQEQVRGGPLEPLVDAVMEALPQILPAIIVSKIPGAANVPAAVDQVVETVMNVLNGVRHGAPLDEILQTVAEGIYDLLPTIIPSLIVGRFGKQAIPFVEPLTKIFMSMIPNPHNDDEGDDGTLETKAELEAYIKKLEEQLSSVGDDAQLANLDLQNNLQKQQQTIQMMSNVSKMSYDTDMAVTRKLA